MVRKELAAVGLCATTLSTAALFWFFSRGYTLYDGDAEAHLNIARRIIDSRTAGLDQFGTGWLPLPHALMLPFVWRDQWWKSGLAGALPSAGAFVAACVLIYAAARRIFPWPAPAIASVAVFALNPNVLYLQSTAMNEIVFLAAVTGLLFTTVWFRQTGSPIAVMAAAVFSNAASLTRYEGWFLIPFVTLFFFIAGGRCKWWAGLLFASIASLGPLGWFAYNGWLSGNPLEFYSGPYSTKAIYERALKAGGARQPGDHNWPLAMQYVWAAATLSAGAPLAWLGVLGAAAAIWKRRWWPVALLSLTPIFYVWSVHSSGAQIFVPTLWPFSYYNTRYGTTLLPLFAIGAAALVAIVPPRFRTIAAGLAVACATAPWLLHPDRDRWVCWKEPQVNSKARRAWTAAAARYLATHYTPGEGVVAGFGDLTGIFRTAGIPLSQTLHEGNNPQWMGAEQRPAIFLKEGWAVTFAGDPVATAIQKANRDGPLYTLVAWIQTPGADVVRIYRRSGADWALTRWCAQGPIASCEPAKETPRTRGDNEDTIHQGARR